MSGISRVSSEVLLRLHEAEKRDREIRITAGKFLKVIFLS
jgi:hypothetical protein